MDANADRGVNHVDFRDDADDRKRDLRAVNRKRSIFSDNIIHDDLRDRNKNFREKSAHSDIDHLPYPLCTRNKVAELETDMCFTYKVIDDH